MFDWFKSAPKAVDNILDKDKGLLTQVGNWIGGMNYTEEERAEMQQAVNGGVVEFIKTTLTENTQRSKTRRTVAIMWIAVELLLVLLTCVTAFIEWVKFSGDTFTIDHLVLSQFYWSVVMSDVMFWGTMSVIGFFFGPYMIGSHFNRQAKK